jgi:hypothetical protein
MRDNDTRLFTFLMLVGLASLPLVFGGNSPARPSAGVAMSSVRRSALVDGDRDSENSPGELIRPDRGGNVESASR